MDEPPILLAALEYASVGWWVLPVYWAENGVCGCGKPKCHSPGKHPIPAHGVDDATDDHAELRKWWKHFPKANLALACGKKSGVWVLDVDGQSGEMSLAAMVVEHGDEFLNTVEQITGKGRHFLFRHTEGLSNKVRFAEGLDIRTDGGYIVIAPSVHVSGRIYTWAPGRAPSDMAPGEAPAWLLSKISTPPPRPVEVKGREISPETEGGRNNFLFKVAYKMRKSRLTLVALSAAVHAENQARCRPPLENDEVEDIIQKAWKKEPGQIKIGASLDPAPRREAVTPRQVATAPEPAAASVAPVVAKKNGTRVDTKGLTYSCKRFDDERPIIRITPEIDLVVDAAEDVLVKVASQLFKRGREIVQVLRYDRSKRKERLLRAEDAPYIDSLETETMRDLLSRVAKWEKWNKTDEEWVQAPASEEIAGLLLARRKWNLRELESVVEWPFLRPDGSLCDRAGYDEASGILYLPSGAFTSIPEAPTREDAVKAMVRLAKPFEEFPFASEWDLPTVMAAVLTVAGRSAIEGPCPAFAVTSPTPGSGKGLLVNLVCSIVMGHEPAVTPWITDDKEWGNAIFSMGKSGDAVVNLDDVDGILHSSALSAALTARRYKTRLFHSQKNGDVPLRTVWFITGNNIGFRGDLFRRVLQIEITPDEESPEDRCFEHDEIMEEVVEQRGELLPAALTVLRAYIQAGKPRPRGLAKKGSYGAWDSLVRGAVLWTMGVDPCKGMEKTRKEQTPDLRLMRTLMSTWKECVGEEPLTLAQLLGWAETPSPTYAPLKEALIGFNSKRDALPSSWTLGNFLAKYRGRPFDDVRLVHCGENRNHSALWAAKPVRAKNTPPSPQSPQP